MVVNQRKGNRNIKHTIIVLEPKVRECFRKIGNAAEWIGKIPCVGDDQKDHDFIKSLQ